MSAEPTAVATAKLRVCANCVEEAYLSTEISQRGGENFCSYCEQLGRTYSIDQIADEVAVAFRDHYDLTPSEPDLAEYHMWMDDEVDYEWHRQGEPVGEVIAEAAGVSDEIAEDIRLVLDDRDSYDGYDKPFDDEAYYEEKEIDDAESQAGWEHFENIVTKEARYFNPVAEAILDSTFEGITQHKTREGTPIIIDAGLGTLLPSFYRARVFQSGHELMEALKEPAREIGPPPASAASPGRMNPHGVSVFYGATDPTVALAEVRPPVGSDVVVARFEVLRPLRLLDIEALRTLNVQGSIFDRGYIERLQKAKFLGWLSTRITQPVMPNDEPFEYLPTQAIADYLATRREPEVHGILYRSAQGAAGAKNVVLFHKASRVEALDIPRGTEIEAYSHHYTEEGKEVDYDVYERMPPASTPTSTVTDPLLMSPVTYDDFPEPDYRELTLRIDLDSMEVRHVARVEFLTENHKVSRHRFERAADS